jgi:hypothetical protein
MPGQCLAHPSADWQLPSSCRKRTHAAASQHDATSSSSCYDGTRQATQLCESFAECTTQARRPVWSQESDEQQAHMRHSHSAHIGPCRQGEDTTAAAPAAEHRQRHPLHCHWHLQKGRPVLLLVLLLLLLLLLLLIDTDVHSRSESREGSTHLHCHKTLTHKRHTISPHSQGLVPLPVAVPCCCRCCRSCQTYLMRAPEDDTTALKQRRAPGTAQSHGCQS